jgi:hypothetical protein
MLNSARKNYTRTLLEDPVYMMSHDGFRLVQYATTNSFKVLSTWFARKETCKIPGTNHTKKIGHILVSKWWASDIRNVLTYRGAN